MSSIRTHRRGVLSGLALAFALAIATPAFAEHDWEEYDRNTPVTLTGTVTDVRFAEPHVVAHMDAHSTSYVVIMASPSRMEDRGATPKTLKVGDKLTVHAYPNKEDPHELRAELIVLGTQMIELN